MKHYAVLTKTEFTKEGNRWIEIETKTEIITEEEFNNITDKQTLKFFRNLGGTEQITKAYTKRGYKPVRIDSKNLTNTKRVIFEFDFN